MKDKKRKSQSGNSKSNKNLNSPYNSDSKDRFNNSHKKKKTDSVGSSRLNPSRNTVAAIVKKSASGIVRGIVKRHPDGFGFLVPADPQIEDVYISRNGMSSAMSNDEVSAEVSRERRGDRTRGEIIEIHRRSLTEVIGKLQKASGKYGMLKDESFAWGEDLFIPLTGKSDQAAIGQYIVAQITQYPAPGKALEGKILQVLGDKLEAHHDVMRVLISHHIPHAWPPGVEAQSKKFKPDVSEKDYKSREDLRKLNFVTIDGATAKDFDDAIYVEKRSGGYQLWVAIADVSHYVTPGSEIDNEAFSRGTSVYFPNYVVPMLPEILSNELCSLRPHIPRLALVAEMSIDLSGTITKTKFYEAVIESKARVTYGEAQEIIDGGTIPKHQHVADSILVAKGLADVLMKRRFERGSLDLEIPETQVVLDGDGIPLDIVRSERLFAHRLIEEMMLAANIAVAEFLTSKKAPSLYRIHEPPKEEALRTLERYLHNFGGNVSLQGALQAKLTQALHQFEGRPQAQVLNILTLRSMSQAKYSTNNLGHFGLGFKDYTHFTSPIRRYPDLIIHRLIKSWISKDKQNLRSEEDELTTAGVMLSACEQRSVKAERQFVSIKKARFMEDKIGLEFKGVISSVTKFGVFVLLKDFDVDGLIRSGDLTKAKLDFDEENLALFNKKTGERFSLGDEIQVVVENANHQTGQIDFKPAGFEKTNTAKLDSSKNKSQGFENRSKPKDLIFSPNDLKPQGRDPNFNPSSHFEKVMSKFKPKENVTGYKSRNYGDRDSERSNDRRNGPKDRRLDDEVTEVGGGERPFRKGKKSGNDRFSFKKKRR